MMKDSKYYNLQTDLDRGAFEALSSILQHLKKLDDFIIDKELYNAQYVLDYKDALNALSISYDKKVEL